jgi:catechol 2,3-dioxygenase-like lactoylglutathione lyase family enzyme
MSAVDQHTASPIMRIAGITIDCDDAAAMASFYAHALGGTISHQDATGAQVGLADGQLLLFRYVAEYQPPTWPSRELPIQLHLEFYVDDVRLAELELQRLGAATAKFQDETDRDLTVMLDPAGHPFCIIKRL